jgi:hypothetical protein
MGGLRTGIFNVADVAIVAGVVLLALASDGARAAAAEDPSRDGAEPPAGADPEPRS